jgi:hypothetical protein
MRYLSTVRWCGGSFSSVYTGKELQRMRASTRRAIRAVLCWPLGVLLVAIWMFWPLLHLRGDEDFGENKTYAVVSTESSSSKSVAMVPSSSPSSEIATLFILLFGPGLLATHSWWTRRKEEEEVR